MHMADVRLWDRARRTTIGGAGVCVHGKGGRGSPGIHLSQLHRERVCRALFGRRMVFACPHKVHIFTAISLPYLF